MKKKKIVRKRKWIKIILDEKEKELLLEKVIAEEIDPPSIIVSVPTLTSEEYTTLKKFGTRKIYHDFDPEECDEIMKKVRAEVKLKC